MDIISDIGTDRTPRLTPLRKGLYLSILPLPVPFINFVLGRVVKHIAVKRPEIFNRLEGHHHKLFLVNPTDLPFFLYLRPNPLHPELKVRRKHHNPTAESKISGSFLALLGMVDGRYDGDAMFFSRDLYVEGDTEAVVCLRNALDDVDGSIAEDIADLFGAPGKKMLKITRRISDHAYHQ